MRKANEKFINKLMNDSSFLVRLCNYSNNDIELVIKNLAKILDYYITNPDCEYPNNIEVLFRTIASSPKIDNYHIIPYNGAYTKTIRHLGIRPELYYKDGMLYYLNSLLSYQPTEERLVVYNNIEEALQNGFTSPKTLYNQILKQPKNKKQPLTVGITEYDYYLDVIETRINNTKYRNMKEVHRLAKKVLKKYTEKGITLCFTKDKETNKPIPAKDLLIISLPSKHQLQKICAFNKNIKIGSKVLDEPPSKKEYPKYSSLSYTRIEQVPIDDTFTYVNPELTGDVSYDIDTVYGRLDYKDTKNTLSSNPDENIARIKNLNDINLVRRNGEYLIENGRHRIVYLKNYYENNKAYYERIGKLNELKRYLTIPVNVEMTIEDKRINELLLSLQKISPQMRFLKVDITNDEPNLVVVAEGHAYHVNGEKELLLLTKYLMSKQPMNEFYIGSMTRTKKNYLELTYHLIATLKEKFYLMNFIEIINYLKTHEVIVNGNEYHGDILDYFNLHACYTDINHRVALGRIRSNEEQIIKDAEAAEINIQLGNMLTSLFKSKPDLILLDVDTLTRIIKSREEFASYPELVIKRSIENNEYRVKNIYNMLKESQDSKRKLYGR